MTATPVTRLELRSEPIPRGPLIERLENELGRPLTHETRHYLAGRSVHCGDTLQLLTGYGLQDVMNGVDCLRNCQHFIFKVACNGLAPNATCVGLQKRSPTIDNENRRASP